MNGSATILLACMLCVVTTNRNKTTRDNRLQVYGGTDANEGEFPFFARIVIHNEENNSTREKCGGSIIEENIILTAAKCVANFLKKTKRDLYRLCVLINEELFLIKELFIHEEYKYIYTSFENDIALIKLQKKLTFTNNVNKIALPYGSDEYLGSLYDAGKPITVIGRGQINGYKEPEKLQKLDQKIVNSDFCSGAISLTSGMLCSGTEGKMKKERAARSDTGSPLFTKQEDGSFVQLALHIMGRHWNVTNTLYDISTKVSTYLSWIDETLYINLLDDRDNLKISQSSTYEFGYPQNAVDGKTNGWYYYMSCSRTEAHENNSWTAIMPYKATVNRVVIYNRQDLFQNRINGVKVYVGEHECGTITYKEGQNIYTVRCDNTLGNIIMITQKNLALTLCEVEAYGVTSEINLLKKKDFLKISQSSTHGFGGPQKAVDGNTNGEYSEGSCSHTNRHTNRRENSFWTATLPYKATVNRVVIYNRQDCCQNRINGVKVYVGLHECGTITYKEGQNIYTVQCDSTLGNIIIITQENNLALTLCEVKAYGVISEINLLEVNDKISQSSTYEFGYPQKAVDGNANGWYSYGSCSHTKGRENNFWRATLPYKYRVNRVVIYNRKDDCQDRINGVKVYVGKHECGTITYEAGQNIYTVQCHNTLGNIIEITQRNDYLTLCEVLAFSA